MISDEPLDVKLTLTITILYEISNKIFIINIHSVFYQINLLISLLRKIVKHTVLIIGVIKKNIFL